MKTKCQNAHIKITPFCVCLLNPSQPLSLSLSLSLSPSLYSSTSLHLSFFFFLTRERIMRLFILLLLLLLRLNIRHSTAAKPLRVPEYIALLSLKAAITDDPQSPLATWNTSTSYCTWAGVTCDSNRHVTALNISGYDLSGTLSSDVGHLRYLFNFTAASNQLSGPVPSQISLLSSLRYLNLSNNGFNGTFPLQLSRLTNLQASETLAPGRVRLSKLFKS